MGAVREVYNKLVKITRCKNCGNKLNSRVTTCESGHTVCDNCYNSLQVCSKCSGDFFDRYHVFYNKIMAALSDKTNYLEQLFDILECPVCYENLTCPSWTCWNGHVTCGRCYFYTTSCPLCREEFTSLYSADINALLSILEKPIKCININHGCNYSNKYKKLKKHEMQCKFRQYQCLVDSCEYIGFLSQLCHHVLHSHPKHICKLDRSHSFDFRLTLEKSVNLITSHSEAYWLISTLEKGKINISIVYIGYKPKVNSVSLTVQNKMFTIPIFPITDMNEPNSVCTLNLDTDSGTIGKHVWCNLTLNWNKSSWLVNTMFVAAIAAHVACFITILKYHIH